MIPQAIASDYLRNPELHWSEGGKFDFCPNTNYFDYRNAYWMAAMSYYSYWTAENINTIFTSPFGEPLKLKLNDRNGLANRTVHTFGLGWKGNIDFFTSRIPTSHSPRANRNLQSSYFMAPLPFEACIKKEKQWCFGHAPFDSRGQQEKDSCGVNLEKTLMTSKRLNNISALIKNQPLNKNQIAQALEDKKRIEYYVTAYEEKNNIDIGLDFLESRFQDRCEVYSNRIQSDFTPDVQALWLDSKDLIVLSIRGTEQDSMIDWKTDLATSFQLNHKYLSFWKKNIHSGYERSLEIMNQWLNAKIEFIFQKYPHASNIPVYITGHSMGGALATIAMTSLIERNKTVPFEKRLNLKSVYSFAAPRIGNINYAQYFDKLANESHVNFFRIVNKNDFVTRAPCIDYVHFGSYLQIIEKKKTEAQPSAIDILVNPMSKKYHECAYGAATLDSIYNYKSYINDHRLESYYEILKDIRHEFRKKLISEETQFANNIQSKNASINPFSYPNNCKRPPLKNFSDFPFLKLNYSSIPFEIEN